MTVGSFSVAVPTRRRSSVCGLRVGYCRGGPRSAAKYDLLNEPWRHRVHRTRAGASVVWTPQTPSLRSNSVVPPPLVRDVWRTVTLLCCSGLCAASSKYLVTTGTSTLKVESYFLSSQELWWTCEWMTHARTTDWSARRTFSWLQGEVLLKQSNMFQPFALPLSARPCWDTLDLHVRGSHEWTSLIEYKSLFCFELVDPWKIFPRYAFNFLPRRKINSSN